MNIKLPVTRALEKINSARGSPRVLFDGSIKNLLLDKAGMQQMIVKISGLCNSYSVAEWLTSFVNMNEEISMTISRLDISTPRSTNRVNTIAECSFKVPLLGWPYFESKKNGDSILNLIVIHISEIIGNMLTVGRSNTGLSVEKTVERGVVTIKCHQ